MPPAAPPRDPGAVQTYFLDPSNGKWNGTILGLKARMISVELKDAYRAPFVPGLALPDPVKAGPIVERHDGRSKTPLIAGILAVIVIIAAGAFGAQAMLGSSTPTPGSSGVAQASATGAAARASASASASDSAAPSADASAPATSAPTQPPVVRTPAPPTPPPTIRLSTKLPDGTTVVYSGPAAVTQNTSFQAIFSAVAASGVGGNLSLTVYLGDPNTPGGNVSVLANKPDANGNYVLNIRATVPKGDQRLSVLYGTVAGIYTLGTITVR